MILISWIGAKAIVASGNNPALGMTTGDLTAFLSYATQILTKPYDAFYGIRYDYYVFGIRPSYCRNFE